MLNARPPIPAASDRARGIARCAVLLAVSAAARAGTPPLEPLEPRLDAVMGCPLVVPIRPVDPREAGAPVEARLEDGRRPAARLVWFGIAPGSTTGTFAVAGSSVDRWLPPTGVWTSTRGGAPSAGVPPTGGTGFWTLIVDIPVDAAGQSVWVEGRRWVLNWLPEPGAMGVPQADWASPVPASDQASPWLSRALEVEARSPTRRWRAGLIRSGLSPGAETAGLAARDAGFADPSVEAMAAQVEGRWRVALARLALADRAVAAQVKRRLAGTADFGGGTIVPAWPVDQVALDAILNDLLTPGLPPQARVERARAWLASGPAATAWVVDDAGQRDAASDAPVATFAIANLGERSFLAWAAVDDQRGGAEPLALRAMCVGTVAASLRAPEPGRAGAVLKTHEAQVHAGAWSVPLAVRLEPVPLTPPGMTVGAFQPEWTMGSWIAGAEPGAAPTEAAWAGAARVLRAQDGGWEVYVECRHESGGEDAVRVWVGAFGDPAAVIKASAAEVVFERGGPDRGPAGFCTAIPGGYAARVVLPGSCVDADGTIRLGFERVDARGARTSWPRPMLPWQSEPGRIALDTRAWRSPADDIATGKR